MLQEFVKNTLGIHLVYTIHRMLQEFVKNTLGIHLVYAIHHMLQEFVKTTLGIHPVYNIHHMLQEFVKNIYTGNTSSIHRIAIYHVSKLSVPVSQMVVKLLL